MYVLISGYEIQGLGESIKSWRQAAKASKVFKKAEGVLLYKSVRRERVRYTLSLWVSKEAMEDFVNSPASAQATRKVQKSISHKTVDFFTHRVPSWDDAITAWKNG
jgi:heme-degrading monooxygenase HmoA